MGGGTDAAYALVDGDVDLLSDEMLKERRLAAVRQLRLVMNDLDDEELGEFFEAFGDAIIESTSREVCRRQRPRTRVEWASDRWASSSSGWLCDFWVLACRAQPQAGLRLRHTYP